MDTKSYKPAEKNPAGKRHALHSISFLREYFKKYIMKFLKFPVFAMDLPEYGKRKGSDYTFHIAKKCDILYNFS